MLDGTLPQDHEPLPPVKGDRGIVGVASPSQIIKKLWHKECFTINGKKQLVRKNGSLSLKRFASTNETGQAWLANKRGATYQSRSDKNAGRISLERQASSSARKKASKGKASSVAT